MRIAWSDADRAIRAHVRAFLELGTLYLWRVESTSLIASPAGTTAQVKFAASSVEPEPL